MKVQGSTAESAYTAVSSWLNLSTVKPEGTRVIARKMRISFLGLGKRSTTSDAEKKKWLALPCAGVGIQKQIKPLVDQGVFRAAVLTSLTMEIALEMLVRGMKEGSQPPEKTFVEAHSYPSLEELAKKKVPGLAAALACFRGVAKPALRQVR